MNKDQWDSLDSAAEANLGGYHLARFYQYKEYLKKNGHGFTDDAEDILTGFIWDYSES